MFDTFYSAKRIHALNDMCYIKLHSRTCIHLPCLRILTMVFITFFISSLQWQKLQFTYQKSTCVQ